jgi:hypothetical protein
LTNLFARFKAKFDRGVAVETLSGTKRLEKQLEKLGELTCFEAEPNIDAYLRGASSQDDERYLMELDPKHQSRASRCLDKTRVEIIDEITTWANDFDAANVLWISAYPGTGKSTIASHVADIFKRSHRLGAFIAFDRKLETSPSVLWRTAALRLAEEYPVCRTSIVDAMRRRVLDNATVDDIFHCLIAHPLRVYGESCDTPTNRLPVIVVDALDECGRSSSDRRPLLSHIKEWTTLSPKFKLVVTSRDEDDIRRTFSHSFPHHPIFIKTGSSVTDTSAHDIQLYLKHRFKTIVDTDGLASGWPGESIIRDLSDRAAGIFIWAATVANYISEYPTGRLHVVLNLQSKLPVGDIHALYRELLNNIFPADVPEASRDFRSLASVLVAGQMSFTVDDLANLLQMSVEEIRSICRKLRSALNDGSLIRFAHQSFVDFLINPGIVGHDASGDSLPCPERFHIDQAIAHNMLVHASFRIMNDRLRFNICNIPSSFLPNSLSIPPDKTDSIIPCALSYACRFVWFHLKEASCDFELDPRHTIPFLREKLLFWLEALSCLGSVNIAASTLAELSTRISASVKSLAVRG